MTNAEIIGTLAQQPVELQKNVLLVATGMLLEQTLQQVSNLQK